MFKYLRSNVIKMSIISYDLKKYIYIILLDGGCFTYEDFYCFIRIIL